MRRDLRKNSTRDPVHGQTRRVAGNTYLGATGVSPVQSGGDARLSTGNHAIEH